MSLSGAQRSLYVGIMVSSVWKKINIQVHSEKRIIAHPMVDQIEKLGPPS